MLRNLPACEWGHRVGSSVQDDSVCHGAAQPTHLEPVLCSPREAATISPHTVTGESP